MEHELELQNKGAEHEKSCGTIIINQSKVLLIGAKDDSGEIFWSFPKGHQEREETDLETALRETFEGPV